MRPTKLLLYMVILSALVASMPFLYARTPEDDTDHPLTAEHPQPGILKNVDYEVAEDGIAVMLTGTKLADYRQFRLSDPFRLVLDLKNTHCQYSRNAMVINDEVLQRIRVAQFSTEGDGVVRIVFDLNKDLREMDVQKVDNGFRIFLGRNVVETASQAPPKVKEIPVEIVATPAPPTSEVTTAPAAKPSPPPADDEPEFTDGNIVRIPEPEITPKPLPEPPAEPEPESVPAPIMMARLGPDPVTYVQDDEEGMQYTGEPITLDIKDADIVDFFRLISDIKGLNIVVDPSVSGSISIKVENVPWDQVFDLALKNNRLDKIIEGNVVRIGTLEAFKQEEKAMEELKQVKEITTEIIKVNYARALEMIDMLTPLLSDYGEIKIDQRTNALVIRDIPERINDVRTLAKALDSAEHQVEIEARIVAASRDFARSIGVQFGFVAGNLDRVTVGGPNTFGTIGGTRPSQTPSSAYIAGDPSTGRGASQTTATQGAAVSVGTEGNNRLGNYNLSLPAQGATSGIGISVGNILDTFLLDASLTAAESHGNVRIISQPKVQAQNNRPATIEQGLQFPVQVVENNTVSVRFFSASLKLDVLPQITEEGTVLLKITVENNRADFVNTVNGIPSIVTSMSATEVLVADGGTTVIGGILIDNDQENVDKVPLLGDIPLLGNLFKRNTRQKSSQEILFFLTPRIMR
ncbi:MAG: type IV pilus secretin PilQ [Acidobacteria bacterium]|nr:type IV pilus secretin PilQ [Acidobacteriota bacterium]